MGWSIAGSYGDWGKSLTDKASNSKDTWYWDAGIAYEYGPFGASFTYLKSQFDCGTVASGAGGMTSNCSALVAGELGKNKLTSYSGGIDYKSAPGLTPYAESTNGEHPLQHGVMKSLATARRMTAIAEQNRQATAGRKQPERGLDHER